MSHQHRPDRNPIRPPGAERRAAADAAAATPRPLDAIQTLVRDGYGLIRRQSRLFSAVFGGVALLLGLTVALQTPQFESTALVLVKVGRELIYTPQVGEQPDVSSRDKQTVINSELAIIRSEPVIAGAVTTVGLASLFPELGEELAALPAGDPETARIGATLHALAAEQFREGLIVIALPEADVLQVSFRHPDAFIAQGAVGAVIDRFTEAHLDAFGEPEVVRFLEERVKTYRESLDAAEAELREFEVAHPVFALETPQTMLSQRMEELRAQIDSIDLQMSSVSVSVVKEDSAVAQAQRERLALEMEASKLKGHLLDDANRRIEVVKHFISGRKAEVGAQVASLQRKRDGFQGQLDDWEAERVQLPALTSAYRQLRRERDAHEEQYNVYQKRMRDARLSHEMDTEKIASISVIQKATLAPAAIWPLPPAVGFVVVLVLAAGIAGLAATLADTYHWTWPDATPAAGALNRVRRAVDQVRGR